MSSIVGSRLKRESTLKKKDDRTGETQGKETDPKE